jgi:hypothetical protein
MYLELGMVAHACHSSLPGGWWFQASRGKKLSRLHLETKNSLGVVVHICNPRTWELEVAAGGSRV